jgi:hypothetical protein
LRGLRNLVVVYAVITVLLTLGAVLANGSLGRALGWWAAGLGIGSLIGLWAYVMYARAFTECSAAGIRTRGLAGQTQCPWAQIARD